MQLTKRESMHKELTENNYKEVIDKLLDDEAYGVKIRNVYFDDIEAVNLLFYTMTKTILTDSDTKNTKAMLEAYLNNAAERIVECEL